MEPNFPFEIAGYKFINTPHNDLAEAIQIRLNTKVQDAATRCMKITRRISKVNAVQSTWNLSKVALDRKWAVKIF